MNARTRFPTTVRPPDAKMLKSGYNNRKLGGRVNVGPHKGAVLYSLSMEERASCPEECLVWDVCYGNNMPFAHRYDHTHPDFFKQLYGAVQRLCASHKKVLLRLHVLGDFFSVEYVRFWYAILEEFPELHLFGYTAHPVTSAIGKEIHNMTLHYGWHRVAIRFSGHAGPRGAVVNSSEGVTCPEQTGHVPSCAECGACWNGEDLINFLEH